jgi:hypothetical protein
MSQANATTNHSVIRRWAEERNGHPAVVKSTKGKRGGLLRIDFGPKEEALDPVDWDEFFRTFDENNLAFLYQERTATGRKSRFAKFVDRDSVEVSADSEDSGDEDSEDSESTASERSDAGTARERQRQRH